MTLLLGLAAACLLFWTGLTLDRSRRFPYELFLSHRSSERGDRASVELDEGVVVLVPARDEAAMLPRTLPALLRQASPAVSVVLVDDGSQDGTAGVAERLAAELGAEDRLRVIRTGPRPPGWVGKMWALESGWRDLQASGVESQWLLLTDADVEHPSSSITDLLAQAARGGYDLVSVMVRLRCETFWERLLIPVFVYFFHLLFPFRMVARRSSSVAAAAGGCVLVRRRVMESIGGFGAIRDAVIDDVSLAVAVKRAGYRLWLGLDQWIESVRPYEGIGDLWRMVSRSAFVQLRQSYFLVVLVVAGLALFFIAPPLLAAAAALVVLGSENAPLAAVRALPCAVGAWLLQYRQLLPFVRHQRVAAPWAVLLPLSSLFYAAMTVSSAWNHYRGRGARWKGRDYGGVADS